MYGLYKNMNSYCIPVSDCVCEGSGGSCTGMRSFDRALEVSGRTASFVGLISVIPNIYAECSHLQN